MGRKDASKRGACEPPGSTGSTSTQATYVTCREEFEEEQLDSFEAACDDLLEKRATTRQRAMAALSTMLRQSVRWKDADACEVTIMTRCCFAFKKGSSKEAVLAADLLCMLLVSVSKPEERHLREVQDALQACASSGSTPARVACCGSLAFCCLLAAEDDACCLEVMAFLRSLWNTADPKVVAVALRGWTLLLARLNNTLALRGVEDILDHLARLLHHGDVGVRNEAGEALALLDNTVSTVRPLLREFELGGEATLAPLPEADEQGETGPQVEGGVAGEEDAQGDSQEDTAQVESNGATPLNGVIARLRQLSVAHPSGDKLRRSKRERAALRATFRGVLARVEGAAVPCVRVKLRHDDVLTVDTPEACTLLAGMRRTLGAGFQTHLQGNDLLHDMFGFRPRATRERLTAAEKRQVRSPNSPEARWRTADRAAGRMVKTSRLMHCVMGDD